VETDVLGNPIPSGSYAYMEVADNGCGMDAETQKKIFEPFFTTKFTGRGLGMSAVLGIIKSHEGAMQLSSTPGVGTTFKVYFPSYDKSNVVETAQTAESGPLPKASGTILLVEDEESIRIIGSALLKAIGFSVITATNGREALDIYRERGSGIDLVLLDLLMPEMGGFETYRILREISHSIPVVICSGCNAAEILEEIGDDEHAAVIQKPYNPGQLRKTLMGLID
jgi:CheY-like chemotaxis protein